MNLYDLPTPSLLVDAALLEENIAHMAQHAAKAGKALRPHAKAHKCPEIARRQVEAGAVGVCAATVSEAELMVRSGIPSVLLTSPIADFRKCMRMAALAASAGIAVVVDHHEHVRLYQDAAKQSGVVLDVLVDLDLGDHRTGVAPNEPALLLVQDVLAQSNLAFRGLQAYSVRASHFPDASERAIFSAGVLRQAAETRELLEAGGIACPVITGGSTGSYRCDSVLPFVTELQAGSYALMDVAYARIEDVNFHHAMTVLATVVSANQEDRFTVDAGFKAFATDRPFGPDIHNDGNSRFEWAGDEFGYVFPAAAGTIRAGVGQRLRLIPPHCDPTVNLYDRMYLCRGETIEDVWPVMDRWKPVSA